MDLARTRRDAVAPFVTADGSLVRELMHPARHAARRQSLAEATVPPGGRTFLHKHRASEEVYHFLGGAGRMRLGEEVLDVQEGDTVCIPPGTLHNLENPGGAPLVLLCACSPAYRDADTDILEGDGVFEARLREHLERAAIEAEHLVFSASCHSVKEAADAAGAPVEAIVKSVCLLTSEGRLVVAVVKGEDRVSPAAVAQAVQHAGAVRLARPMEMLARTAYPAGGTPPFGSDATFLVDERVLERDVVYAGGGSSRALVRVAPRELLRANGGRVARVRQG